MMAMNISIIGAGLSGAVLARQFAEAGLKVTVYESRNHIAGNCHTQRDSDTGVMIHVYGPHIFHTNDQHVWEYIQKFDVMMPFVNRVKANVDSRIYSLPINLMTINSFYNKCLNPQEAKEFICSIGDQTIHEPKTFEEQALRFVGKDLYEAFFKGYTEKQWGMSPAHLPASILKRLPIRFNYDDNYYESRYQGMPLNGYTHLVGNILDHSNITVKLSTSFRRSEAAQYDHVFYSGPIDAWFNFSLGALAYRTLDFQLERHQGDYQGNAVMNYCDPSIPWTRISEHKHFAPWERHANTVIYKEYSRVCGKGDIPYYPIRLAHDKTQLNDYFRIAQREKNVTFMGRLGTYRYLDMDVAISEALTLARESLNAIAEKKLIPHFSGAPVFS